MNNEKKGKLSRHRHVSSQFCPPIVAANRRYSTAIISLRRQSSSWLIEIRSPRIILSLLFFFLCSFIFFSTSW